MFSMLCVLGYHPHIRASVLQAVANPGADNVSNRQPVIMCMIFTTPEQWMFKAMAVRLTWAKR